MGKPVIGRLYRPKRFQTRASDGTYSAYNCWPESHEARLQAGLLGDEGADLPSWKLAVVLVVLAYAVAVVWGAP